MTIASHTIVKNGMPFIGKVLNQVAPYMDKMFISVSEFSTDETLSEVEKFIDEHPTTLVEFMRDSYDNPSDLTKLRNFQVERTMQDWILFLDDDDYWPHDQLEFCLKELDKDEDVLAYSVSPWQLVDFYHYDWMWRYKSYSKFLRNRNMRYKGDWPMDLPCDENGNALYWKTHPAVKRLPYRYYHLARLKNWSFRNEGWADYHKFNDAIPVELPQPFSL